MPADNLGAIMLLAPFLIAACVIIASAPPAKKEPELKSDLTFIDPEGTLRAITALLVASAVVRSKANPVQGRRPGLSEHAFPFGQTERRAKRTLDRPPP